MTPCVLADRTVFHIKLVPTDCSMVDSPCPDVASHISLAKWTPVHYAFLCNNPILNRKLVPTDCSMVYLPCRHVTGHMPIASGTNVVILFRTGASFPDSEIVAACAAVIDLACSYRLLLPSLAALPSAVRCCRPVCHVHLQDSVVISVPFSCLRCFAFSSASFVWGLSCSLFRFRSAMASQTSAMARAFFFFFRCPPRDFRLRCSYPLYRFADASPGNGALIGQHYKNDVAPARIQKRTLLALPCRRCISTSPMLYPNNLNTLYRLCVLLSRPRQKISFRPCVYCKHYTLVSVRTFYKYDKMWLVALHVLS